MAKRAALAESVPAERLVSERAATRAADERIAREIAAELDDLNALVRRHNLLVASASVHLAIVTIDVVRAEARGRSSG